MVFRGKGGGKYWEWGGGKRESKQVHSARTGRQRPNIKLENRKNRKNKKQAQLAEPASLTWKEEKLIQYWHCSHKAQLAVTVKMA